MTFGSLFSGVGGIDLGLERAGMTCKWQVEIDPFCRKVLAKHWPDVRRYEDVRTVGADNLEPVDVIAGGFPCQDVSEAGNRAGIKEGTRSGLWFEYHRIICELRPRYVLVENVTGLLSNGMDRVLGELAESGYDAEWQVLSAADMGAPHQRKRVFIIATMADSKQSRFLEDETGTDARRMEDTGRKMHSKRGPQAVPPNSSCANVAHPTGQQCNGSDDHGEGRSRSLPEPGDGVKETRSYRDWWTTEPNVGRVANGVPDTVDRLKSLGNAVVPQCAEYIGRMIMGKELT
jgi:DNA (cytosine-5)-methyltransferase 1